MIKLMIYLLIVSAVCTFIGYITGVTIFTGAGIFGFCGAGVVFLAWVFKKMFLDGEGGNNQ